MGKISARNESGENGVWRVVVPLAAGNYSCRFIVDGEWCDDPCSALLPLTISFGQKELTSITASAAGGPIAFCQIGCGIAVFGVGPLQTWGGLDLNLIYGGTAAVALAMAAVSFAVTRKYSAPA